MDEIIERGDPFDCDENTSQEDKRIRSRYEKTKKREESKGLITQDSVLMNLSSLDGFTCFVQEMIAKTLFRSNIPSQPPNRELDDPELYKDKVNYHRAVAGSKEFREKVWIPLKEKVSEKMAFVLEPLLYDALLNTPRLLYEKMKKEHDVHFSDWSNTPFSSSGGGDKIRLTFITTRGDVEDLVLYVLESEAEYIKALHNLFHLEKYVATVIIECAKDPAISSSIENYTHAWTVLTTPHYAEKYVKDWDELTFIDFVDYIYSLHLVIEFFQK